MYYPTRWDWMTFIGTIGMFLAAMFLFVRVLPMISIFEMRTLLPEAEVKEWATVVSIFGGSDFVAEVLGVRYNETRS
jgi:hypothetical protein